MVNEKRVIVVVGLLLLLTAINVVRGIDVNSQIYPNISDGGAKPNATHLIYTEKDNYFLGESVLIYLNRTGGNYSIDVNSSSASYNFFGDSDGPAEFKPDSTGTYLIIAKNKNGEAVSAKKFTVAENKSKGEILIYTGKSAYYKGESVTVYLNFTKKDSYVLYINSEEGIYKFLGVPGDTLIFNPKSAGRYLVKIEENGKVLASSSFWVIEEPADKELEIFYLDKEVYGTAETVNIRLNFKVPIMDISWEGETIEYFNATEIVAFRPQKPGNYTITAHLENVTVSKNFTVMGGDAKPVYSLSQNREAVVEFDFRPIADKKRSILDIIFGTSPIEQVKFYVENYSNDSRFILSAEQAAKENFRVAIKTYGMAPGAYTLVAEIVIDGEKIYENRTLQLEKPDFQQPESNAAENESYKKQLELIKRYINYSFELNEDAIIDVEFTKDIDAERGILDLVLKNSKLQQLTAFVEGHDLDKNFNLSISRVEFDRFLINVKSNEKIPADVYKIVAIGKAGDRVFTKQKKFSWGINDLGALLERIDLKKKALDQERQKLNLFSNKKQYRLGEEAHLYTNADISVLNVIHNGSTFSFFGSASDISFAPQSEGMYFVEAQINGVDGALTANFSVAANAPLPQKEVRPFAVNIKNGKMEDMRASLKFYRNGSIVKIVDGEKEKDEEGAPFEIGNYDMDMEPKESQIKNIRISGLKFEGPMNIGIDSVSDKIKSVDEKPTAEVYAIDAGSIRFASATVTAKAKGTELYKCRDWNFALRSCRGSWEKFMDLIPGSEYSFNLMPGDPGFAETGLASINTNKSVYHPNEEARIIMVVLDTAGHLVSGANVSLNVTDPASADALFTTDDGSVTETEKGIYESKYQIGALGGNYSMLVHATGNNVNSSMLSFFAVSQFYEFDILRQAPSTTDPFKAPFNSSAKIISLAGSSLFNYTEVLPINFTVENSGGAAVSVINDKKYMSWNNLQNNSIVSYVARPPLVTPELWELGPSVVGYSGILFSEARPWFLAVDPFQPPINISQRTCSAAWGFSCTGTTDDTYGPCTHHSGSNKDVLEIYLNGSVFKNGDDVNVTCNYDGANNDLIGIYYNDSYNMYQLFSGTASTSAAFNKSLEFIINSSAATQFIRCIISGTGGGTSMSACPTTAANFDNDDVNFSISSPIAPQFTKWNLSNDTNGADIPLRANITRGDIIDAYAQWNALINSSLLEHNGNGTFVNFSNFVGASDNFTNFTLDTSNTTQFTGVGLVNVTGIYAEDRGYYNKTTSPLIFFIYGTVKISDSSIDPPNIIQSNYTSMLCRVTDENVFAPYVNYNVTFWNNATGYLGYNLTNSNGYANMTFNNTALGTNNITCNITANINNYFYTSSTKSAIQQLTVLQVGADVTKPTITAISASPSQFSTATLTTISANATDNINLSSVRVNITYPSAATAEFNMARSTGDIYKYNFSDTSSNGIYTYFIIAVDNASPSNKQASSSYTFEAIGTRAVISIQTINTSYKHHKDVNLTFSSTTDFGDQESGIRNVTAFPRNLSTRTCTDAFGSTCSNGALDDTFDTCNAGTNQDRVAREVYLNATSIKSGDTIKVTCEYDPLNSADEIEIWYYDGASFSQKFSGNAPSGAIFNQSATFTVSSTSSNQWARCIIDASGEGVACPTAGRRDVDDANFTVDSNIVDDEGNTSDTTYADIGNQNFSKISDIQLNINVISYNRSGSVNASNTNPDLQVKVYDGSDYNFIFSCDFNTLTSSGSVLPVNCSKKITNGTVVSAWNNSLNRKLRINGIYFDEENNKKDIINWSGVFVLLNKPSKIENFGIANVSNISARVLLQAQFYNATSTQWNSAGTIYNNSVTVGTNQTINLSNYWNPNPFNTQNRELGSYRAYAALTDSSGNVLGDENNVNLTDTYNFTLDFLRIVAQNPLNNSVYDANGFWANLTLNYTSFPSGGFCNYSIDNKYSASMPNDTRIHFYNFTSNISEGIHNITYYCNDTTGDINYENITFNATDQQPPIINLSLPPNGGEVANGNVTFAFNVTDTVSTIRNCTLEFQFADNQTNISIAESTNQSFKIYNLENGGPYSWRIMCADNSSNRNVGNSSYFSFLVGADTDLPIVIQRNPIDGYNTSNNDVLFDFRVNDITSNIKNCSLVLKNQTNQTNASIVEQGAFPYVFNNFTVNDMPDGNYTWSVNCTDTSNNANVGNSTTRTLTVNRDTDFPAITLLNPANNITDTDGIITFDYNVTDASSNIANCTLFINNTLNSTAVNPTKSVLNTFSPTQFNKGVYNWRVNCTDDSFSKNSNISDRRNFTVDILSTLNLVLTTDKPIYEQGTQSNDTAEINSTTKDAVSNSINASVTEQIIYGNTTLRWWNESYLRRIPIILNDSIGSATTNISVEVNISGLNGFIKNCTKEIRIIENYSANIRQIPSKVATADDSTYCSVVFFANISTGAANQSNYYAYYNNSGSPDPNYNVNIRNSSSTTCGNVWGGNCGATGGSAIDDTFDGCNSASPSANTRVNQVYLNATRVELGDVLNATCEVRETANDVFAIWYNNSVTWTLLKSGIVTTAGSVYNESVTFTVSSNKGTQYIRCIADVSGEGDNCADSGNNEDDDDINFFVGAKISNNSKVSGYQRLINKTTNDTGANGLYSLRLSTTGLETGVFSIISDANSIGYNNASNFSNFRVAVDQTAPNVGLVSPNAGNVSAINNITFIFNVSDTLSGIQNCSLIINNTINMTNASITEDTRQNFTFNNVSNGVYSWNINCTDDSSNNNVGTATARLLAIAVDTAPPTVTLSNPQNNYTDTNRNVSFNYSVTDDLTSTADCTLYINGTANTTQLSIPTDGSARNASNLTLFNNGTYRWYVNCTDNSIARNFNVSPTRNFTVMEDLEGPAINLEFPANGAQLTKGNVTFRYNTSDAISNVTRCSLSINGTLNITNTSIIQSRSQNFTVNNLNGYYNWSINCTDGSENPNVGRSAVRTLLVAPDVEPPIISLEFPPNNIQLGAGNISFRYNVSDLASDIQNCSLYINRTLNYTNISVNKDISQNFTASLTNGIYNWHVNCTDNSANFNFNISETRNLTIGADTTPPDITLQNPVTGFNDTNGALLFEYSANDIASTIANCSIIINSTINKTNNSITELITQNFTISGFNNGTYQWNINCTDNSSGLNTGNSSSRLFTVLIDQAPPIINLADPPNSTTDTNGNRIFYYNASDSISSINNCSLIINNKLNQTNNSIIEDAKLNFTVNGFADGDYNWSVNCTDTSDNLNIGASAYRILTVTNDNVAPAITLQAPANNSIDTNGNQTFNYTVADAISGIANCTLKLGSSSYANTSITESITQQFNITGLTTADYNWNITCADDSENSNSAASQNRNLSTAIDNSAPVVNLITPLNYTQEVINNVTFFYNVSDTSAITNCSLIINGTINQSNKSLIAKDSKLNFTAINMSNGTFLWSVNCSDTSENNFVGASESRIVIVNPDIAGPTVNLANPPNGIQDPDGNVTFEYNATDFASGISNCTLIMNGTRNQTTPNPQEDIKLNFTLNDTALGDYVWQVNCTDNSSNANIGSSEVRNLTIGQDITAPIITLVSPANNTLVNSPDALFEFTVVDFSSDISNCSLIINDRLNITNNSISESSSNLFLLQSIGDGDYNWSINCTDSSPNNNTGSSARLNFSIFAPKQIIADIYTNATSYEQGELASVTVNATNGSLQPFNSDIYIDIIRGNTTAPFFDSSWSYRVPVDINATNVTRKNSLIELNINFTEILVNDLGITGKTFDFNSIRVMEWANNRSWEVVYQFANSSGFSLTGNAAGTLNWILNGTTPNSTIRNYFVYFDVAENGAKPGVNYSAYIPSFTFAGSSKTVIKDGTSNNADYVRVDRGTESISLQFANGQDITNQQNIDYQGAGSIWNITAGSSRISNYYDSIIPVAIYNNYFLNQNGSANITSGPVFSKIRIPGYLNGTTGTDADLNYTIWFGGNEIIVKADLYVKFNQANNDPLSLFNNLWFAYLFDYASDWSSFIKVMNSTSFGQTHRYHLPNADSDTTNQFNSGDLYSEYNSQLGSINIYVDKFALNGAESQIGSISYDDWYNPASSKLTESDGVGFNLNSDQAVAAGDAYSVTVWMILSGNKTPLRAVDLKNYVENPVNISQGKGQRLVNRTANISGSSGIFRFNWSTAGKEIGNYTAAVIANKTLYTLGTDYSRFVITRDTSIPSVKTSLNKSLTNISINDVINLSANASDTNALSFGQIIINDTGFNRYFNFSLSGVDAKFSQNITISCGAGCVVNFTARANDTANNFYTNDTIITVVNTPPAGLSVVFPTNNLYTNMQPLPINVTFAADPDGNAINVSYYINGNLNQTSLKNTTFNASDGTYILNVSISDGFNHSANITVNFTIDTKAPIVNATLNKSASLQFGDIINITANSTDETGLSLGQVIINDTGFSRYFNFSLSGKSAQFSQNITLSCSSCVINFTARANDSAGNFRNNITMISVGNTPPATPIILIPINGSRNNKQPLGLNITFPRDPDNNPITIYYYINGTLNQTSAGNTTFNASDGVYLLNVSLSDSSSFSSNATSLFSIDTVRPIVNSTLNKSSSIMFGDVINISANATDESGLDFGQIIVNQTGAVAYFNFSLSGATGAFSSNINISAAKGAVINFTARANDTAGNSYINSTIITTVNAPPKTATILFPTGLLNTTRQPLDINVTFPADGDNDALTIYYYINGNLNQTSATNTTLNASDGNYILNATVYDGTVFSENSTVSFTIDTTSPAAAQQYPPNNYYNDSADPYSLLINCSATDNLALNNLTLYITDRLNQSFSLNRTAKISGTSGYANWTLNLQNGNYTWNCLAYDTAGNLDWGDNRSLLINASMLDLAITASDIAFNNTLPIEDENVTINATIRNTGFIAANNVKVQFFDGSPANGIQLDSNRTIAALGPLQNFTVNATFRISLGMHEIFVAVDPDNSISESSESNNNASKNITVPIWHIITGNVTGNLLLESVGNRTVFSWNTSAATSGNILVVDSDSSITWTNLTALGRNLTGGNSSNDWQELDTALNTSNSTKYPDSINSTFTSGYAPMNTTSFVVFANTIYNVSIANSTNSSNFVTGILWDKSDDRGDNQYNGSEDVVFITEIRRNQAGQYGNYDFEIRVPSLLKKYKGPDINSVTFYVELI